MKTKLLSLSVIFILLVSCQSNNRNPNLIQDQNIHEQSKVDKEVIDDVVTEIARDKPILEQISKFIILEKQEQLTDEQFNKYWVYEYRNIGNKAITSIILAKPTYNGGIEWISGNDGQSEFLQYKRVYETYTINLKPRKSASIELLNDKSKIIGIRFSDGSAINVELYKDKRYKL